MTTSFLIGHTYVNLGVSSLSQSAEQFTKAGSHCTRPRLSMYYVNGHLLYAASVCDNRCCRRLGKPDLCDQRITMPDGLSPLQKTQSFNHKLTAPKESTFCNIYSSLVHPILCLLQLAVIFWHFRPCDSFMKSVCHFLEHTTIGLLTRIL